MFDIAPTELMLVAIVALVVIGPKDLPRAMRFVGQWVARARGMARHFRSGLDEMVRQADLEDMERRWAEENARIMREHPASPHPAEAPVYPGDAQDAPHGAVSHQGDHGEPSHAYAMTPLPPAGPGATVDTGPHDAAIADRRELP